MTGFVASLAFYSSRGYEVLHRLFWPVPNEYTGFGPLSGARHSCSTGRFRSASTGTQHRISFDNWYHSERPLDSSIHGYSCALSTVFSPITHKGNSCVTEAVEDFFVDNRIPTLDCSGGRLCRAQVVVSKEGTQVTVKSGYYIYSKKGVTPLNPYTLRNVKMVTLKESAVWAKKLLSMVQTDLRPG